MSEVVEIPTPFNMRAAFVPEVPETLRHLASTLQMESTPALRVLRESAWDAFTGLGLPATKHEDFTFVSAADLRANLNRAPERTGESPLDPAQLPAGVRALTAFELSEGPVNAWRKVALPETDAPAALALALAPDPLALRVAASATVSLPLRFQARSARQDYAVFVHVEENATVALRLETELDETAFVNAAVYVTLGQNARLKIFQQDAAQGVQLLKLRVNQEKDSRVELLSISTGSRLARFAIEADLNAPGCEIDLRGASALAGSNRSHRFLRIRHAAPHCVSNQLFKCVVPAAGRSSMDGTVIVDKGAQQTDARQLLQHLLMSKEGRADAKPRLLIHADDVKCSHGATVGKTDPAQKFYLLSRGLDSATADRLLTQAFLNEALEIFPEMNLSQARETLMSAIAMESK